MKSFLIFTLFFASIALVGACASYFGGRVVLPEMGLTAPNFGTWFWFYVVTMPFIATLGAINSFLDD